MISVIYYENYLEFVLKQIFFAMKIILILFFFCRLNRIQHTASDVRQNMRSSSHQAMPENALTLIAKY
jgi:hypothetical protein